MKEILFEILKKVQNYFEFLRNFYFQKQLTYRPQD